MSVEDNMFHFVRVVSGYKGIFKRCFFFANKLKIREGASWSEANESHGERRASYEALDGAH